MDVYDAGVYVDRFEAQVPGEMRTPLWGPLHAKELGLPGWEAQDGGETGFVYHKKSRTRKVGTLLTTLIVSNRARRATLTVTLAGYPTHVPVEQRHLETLSLVTEAEVFLTRLAGRTIAFTRTASITLVDQNHPHEEILDRRDVAPLASAGETAGAANPTRRMGRLPSGRREGGEASGVWDVF